MTSYIPRPAIYVEVLGKLLEGTSGTQLLRHVPESEEAVLEEVRKLRRDARLAREEARKPDFSDPIVGYIPAYGVEEKIRAMLDYCRLRRMARRSELFAAWLAERVVYYRPLYRDHHALLSPPNVSPYRERPGEKYMNRSQLKHFLRILCSWKRELLFERSRRWERWQIYTQLRYSNLPDPGDYPTCESELPRTLHAPEARDLLVERIDEAIRRIRSRSYGYCVASSEPIGIRRLEEYPLATTCPAEENRRRTESDHLWYK